MPRSELPKLELCQMYVPETSHCSQLTDINFFVLGFVRARGGGDIRDVNTNSENWAVVKGALVAGMYPNIVHVDRENIVLTGPKEKKVRFHPTSVLSQPQYKKVRWINMAE